MPLSFTPSDHTRSYRSLDSWEIEKIRDHQPDVVWLGMIPYISDVSFEWVRGWADSISDTSDGSSIGMKEWDSRRILHDYLDRTYFIPRFGQSRSIYGSKNTVQEITSIASMHLQGAVADSEQFRPENRAYACLFLFSKIDRDIVASWDDRDMSKLVRYVVAGFPHETILDAFDNDIDLSMMESLGGVA